MRGSMNKPKTRIALLLWAWIAFGLAAYVYQYMDLVDPILLALIPS